MNRPQPTIEDMEEIRRRSSLTGAACFNIDFEMQVKYQRNNIPSTTIYGVSTDYDNIRSFDLDAGGFSPPLK
jgi:hypothetical protein